MQYSKSLRKLSKTTAARKFKKFIGPSQMPLTVGDPSKPAQDAANENRLLSLSRIVYFAFEQLLSDTEQMAREFHEINESILTRVTESIKELSMQKVVLAKKTNDYGVKHQLELAQQYDELEKALYINRLKFNTKRQSKMLMLQRKSTMKP